MASRGVATVSAGPGPPRPTGSATQTCPTTPVLRTATRPSPPSFLQQPSLLIQPPAPPVVQPPVHPVVKNYNWPAPGAPSSLSAPSTASETEPETFAIVLKDGSTLSAVTVFASDDGLHFVDPDERHLRISMSEVDRAATLKLNRARNLNLYLPAAQ